MRAEAETHRAIDAVYRIEAPKLIATLTRMVRDISLAEELAQEALLVAMREWPQSGIPENPAAWLTATGKRKAIDHFRHRKMAATKLDEISRDLADQEQEPPDLETALDDDIGDDLLRMIFTACHPILSAEASAALTLRVVGGLTTEEIARAFLVPTPTMAQRIVRAKKVIADAGVPFEVPHGDARHARLKAVLAVLYLIFNEGYSATAGDDWMRPQLANEALRLGRILAGLAPDEPEIHGLLALMEIQASRFKARVAADGAPILLLDQDRSRWDRLLIRRGLAALDRATELGGAKGPYALQAAIAACHARATDADSTDWPRLASLYDELAVATPSPVIEVNRAVAHSFAYGPAAGLAIIDPVMSDRTLAGYHLLPAVRGDLLARLGRNAEARAELERAATLARNEREQALLAERAAALSP